MGDKKKFVRKHEVSIDDIEEEIKGESNSKVRKEKQALLKKLQTDEFYVQVVKEIAEEEAEAVRAAERASLEGKAEKKTKAAGKALVVEQVVCLEAAFATTESTMMEIDVALSSTAKDSAALKSTAIAQLETIAGATPFVLPRIEALIGLFADPKLGASSVKAACLLVANIRPRGHGVASTVIPSLLAGMEDKKWKTKAGCIDVMIPGLRQLEEDLPDQLGQCLPLIVMKLAEAALDTRKEIRSSTASVLRQIGTLVANPEIQKLSQDVVSALVDPTNQKLTQEVLSKMGNTTFMSRIDAASLAFLMPIVIRGLKGEASSKKWAAQIFGSTARLVVDVDFVRPYLSHIIPILKNTISDSVPEVQRESAKAFGTMEQVLPNFSREQLQPWLFDRLRNASGNEQTGAALALAEVFVKMEKEHAVNFIPELRAATAHSDAAVRCGFLELMDCMPQAMKMDFAPFIEPFFPVMLMGMARTKDEDEDTGYKASLALVQRFGDLCPDLLLPAFEITVAATLCSTSPKEWTEHALIREKSMTLLGKMVDKILEHKRFGQDLLTTEDCSTKEIREKILCLLFVVKSDEDGAVKRIANGVWKTAGGAPRMQKAISPAIHQSLLRYRSGEMGSGLQKLASSLMDGLVKTGEMEGPSDEMPEASPFIFEAAPGPEGSDSSLIAAGKPPSSVVSGTRAEKEVGEAHTAGISLVGQPSFVTLPVDVRNHCRLIVESVVREGEHKKLGGKSIAAQVVAHLKVALGLVSCASEVANGDLASVVELSMREAMGTQFDAEAEGDRHDSEVLLKVDNLLLMYGAGMLLLSDTTLEMKKNACYGVVGQNGAGKTTLMKEIVSGNIVGMPQHLKCVHVDDSKLGEMSKSCLSAVEYMQKMAQEIGVTNATRDTLLSVGFEEKMLDEAVSDFSTGWRMRLTLAVSMLKHADLVLLDEPTNHLDEESVEWLATYVKSINQSSVMVISHEPKFLNKITTHIIAYVDKKLEYTEGNFDSFAAKKGLTKEQISSMLSGNLSFDTLTAGEGGQDGQEGAAPKVSAIAGPPKLTFPIAGQLEGVKSGTKPVLELKNVCFRYSKEKDYLVRGVNGKLSLNSRVAICGRNGCGKSTLMTLLCSEMSVSEDKEGNLGEVDRHCNLRLAYMKQDHLKALGPFFNTSPFVYITERFKDGWDGDLQKRLIEPEDEEEARRRKELAKKHGKYGSEVGDLLNRSKQGTTLWYEVKWAGLDDPKQNTVEPLSKLKMMGLDKVVKACDERIAAKMAGLDQRPLTRREIVRHCEAFGIDEEMCCNRQIRGFSAGQKVRLSLAAMFWTKPHLVALDEPTNYLDVETVEALTKALMNFRGGVVLIEPKTDFVEKICNEKWHLEDGEVTVEKLNNGVKRRA